MTIARLLVTPIRTTILAFVSSTLFLPLVVALPSGAAAARDLTFEDRVAAQKAIEQVYWDHRVWPKENPAPKPRLSAVMSDDAIRAKVEDYLRMSALLNSFWRQPIRGEELQAEVERMVRQTKAPETLREIFVALNNDPFLFAECLARPLLAQQLIESTFASDERIHGSQRALLVSNLASVKTPAALARLDGEHAEITFILDDHVAMERTPVDPADRSIRLNRDEWGLELGRLAASFDITPDSATGALPVGQTSPLLDRGDRFVALSVLAKGTSSVTVASVSWPKRGYGEWAREVAASSLLDAGAVAPPARGYSEPTLPLVGCTDDTWTPTSLGANVPVGRYNHTAVWTGAEMIVWGGYAGGVYVRTGGRYTPSTDSWTPSSLASGSGTNVPAARGTHTAVWTGTEMIVWGGLNGTAEVNTGGRYNPSTDTWAASSLTSGSGANVPAPRNWHTAVWTGTEMIVWGGFSGGLVFNTGGRYNPSTDMWAASSLTAGSGANVAPARGYHVAVWTGTEMIVWGGSSDFATGLSTGGRYSPSTDTWAASSLTTGSGANVPPASAGSTAVWTDSELIVWGGQTVADTAIKTGGRYKPSTDTWAVSSLTTGSGTNVPEARADLAAVWTGAEMIVWGGWGNFSDYLTTGGRYKPSSDTWTSSSLTTGSGANVPAGRYYQTAVWTGSSDHRMIVWGGFGAAGLTQSGGLYCACILQAWYQDLDGDGRGNPSVSQSSCAQPTGFVAVAGDCNDANAAVWSIPGEVRSLVFTSRTSVGWTASSEAGGTAPLYDTIRSSSPSDFNAGGTCVESNGADTTSPDASTPAVGAAFYYLVRAETSCGSGTLGQRSSGVDRSGRNCP